LAGIRYEGRPDTKGTRAAMETPRSNNDFQPRHLVTHLWKRRWLLVAIPVLAFAAAWAGAQSRRATTFESRATVLLRTPPRLSAEDRTPMGHNPPAFRSMFMADATLDRARQAIGSTAPIESWRGRFS